VRYTLRAPVAKDGAILAAAASASNLRGTVLGIVRAVKDLLERSNVVVPGKSELEISHHYGLEQFQRFGLTMITVVNREYCKKLLVLLPGQTHPEQYHQQKEETFVVLHGEMTLKLDGAARVVRRGDVVTVDRGVRHEFHTDAGVVFEEISSTHVKDDSYYSDPAINANKQRKTHLTYWM
jgi:quercetin dioxygenase-like cupin family protein